MDPQRQKLRGREPDQFPAGSLQNQLRTEPELEQNWCKRVASLTLLDNLLEGVPLYSVSEL